MESELRSPAVSASVPALSSLHDRPVIKQALSSPSCLGSEWFITSTEKLNWEFSFLCELGAPYFPHSSLKGGSRYPTQGSGYVRQGGQERKVFGRSCMGECELGEGRRDTSDPKSLQRMTPLPRAGMVVHICNPNTQHKG